ncbi:putative CtpA-like serine protease [compost metagenome]
MLSSSRFFVSSLIVLAVGVSLFLSRSKSDMSSRVKSAESYWTETGLGAGALEDLLQDPTCVSSERYFLACTNAVLAVAGRYNMTISLDGKLIDLADLMSADMSSEKKQLTPWKEFYHSQHAEAQKISFISLWNELVKSHIPEQQRSLMVGVGLNGFISVFRDPHTYFMPVAMFKEVISKADNRSTSLGILLGRNQGEYVIRKVVAGSPADAAGLKKGDALLKVNGQKVTGLLQSRVNELLKGDVGSVTRLRISHDGVLKTIKLRRTEITVATVSTRIIDGLKPVAVVTVNKFAKDACLKTRVALEMANNANVRGLLLDLRDNPGGQMEEAACIASLFVGPEKKIFEIRYLDLSKPAESFNGSEEQIFTKPMAVLINGSSASAAEIVAGALRDLNRAVLVGESSFGKGSFQEGEFWSQNKKIALFETKGFYYLPSGRSPQMVGLEPDVKVAFDEVTVGREADQFMNPLKAPERTIRLAKTMSAKDCLQIEEGLTGDDQQLNKAREVLFCTKAVAGAQ